MTGHAAKAVLQGHTVQRPCGITPPICSLWALNMTHHTLDSLPISRAVCGWGKGCYLLRDVVSGFAGRADVDDSRSPHILPCQPFHWWGHGGRKHIRGSVHPLLFQHPIALFLWLEIAAGHGIQYSGHLQRTLFSLWKSTTLGTPYNLASVCDHSGIVIASPS